MRAYKDTLVPFMPGDSDAEHERAFFLIFSTMIGSIEIAEMIPYPGARQQILTNTRNFLLLMPERLRTNLSQAAGCQHRFTG
jgi:hypothetical protein